MSIVAFVALTFAISWASWFGAGALPPGNGGLRQFEWWLLITIGTFAPAISAVTFTFREGGRKGVVALVARLVQGGVAPRWYSFALLYLFVIKVTVAGVYRATYGAWPAFGTESLAVMLIATLFSTVIFAQSGEELGWRGFMLPRLAARFGFAWSSIIVGVVWAAWHLPFFFIADVDKTGQSFPIWALSVIAMSVAFTWLYAHTGGSLMLAMLMHAAVNNLGSIVPSATPGATEVWTLKASPVMLITLAMLWIAAAYFLAKMPKVTAAPAPAGGPPAQS